MGFQKKETSAPLKSTDVTIRPLITGQHAAAVDRLAKAVNLSVPAVITELIAAAFAHGLDCASFAIDAGTPLVSEEMEPVQAENTPAPKKGGYGKHTTTAQENPQIEDEKPLIDLEMPKI